MPQFIVLLYDDPTHWKEMPVPELQAAFGKYGAWGKKSMYGKTLMGVIRATFLVDAQGRIARIWPKVKVDGHAAEVLAAAQEL